MSDSGLKIAVKLPGETHYREVIITDNTLPLVAPVAPGENSPHTRGLGDRQVGIIVPLFVEDYQNAVDIMHYALIVRNWQARGVHFITVIDANQGPGLSQSGQLVNAIRLLKVNGATVIGYINTSSYENQVMVDMANWKAWYPELDGYYFDHLPQMDGAETYFRTLDSYAKYDLSCHLTVAAIDRDPQTQRGAGFDGEAYLRDTGINIFVIYRDRGLPQPISALKRDWMSKYPRSRFGCIATNLARLNIRDVENFVSSAVGVEKAFGYVYLHSDAGARNTYDQPPGPFDHISSFLEVTARSLSSISDVETRELPDLIQRSVRAEREIKESMAPSYDEATGTMEVPSVSAGRYALPAPEHESSVWHDSDQSYDRFGIRKMYLENMAINRAQTVAIHDIDDFNRLLEQGRIDNARSADDVKRSGRQGDDVITYHDGDHSFEDEDFTLKVLSESSAKKWLNTEQTAYFRYTGTVEGAPHAGASSKYAVQFVARGGDHDSKTPWEAACYKARLYVDGRVAVIKEVAEGIFCEDISPKDSVTGGVSVQDRWMGVKMITYNWQEEDELPIYAVIEVYVDDQCDDGAGNLIIRNQSSPDTWRLAARAIDKGQWPLRDPAQKKDFEKMISKSKAAANYRVSVNQKEGKQRSVKDIISEPGGTANGAGANICAIRAQGSKLKWKHYSVREINPPAILNIRSE